MVMDVRLQTSDQAALYFSRYQGATNSYLSVLVILY